MPVPADSSPALPDGYVTYVVYTRPSTIIPGGEITLQRATTRDIAALRIPPDAFEFYFCDAPADSKDPLGDERNASATFYVAVEVIGSDELQDRLLAKGVLKSRESVKATRDKDGNLTRDVIRHAVWLTKSKSTPWHAIGAGGEILQIYPDKNITVIDHNKNILMGPEDAMPRARMPSPAAPLRMPAPPRPRDSKRYKL